jgi:DNA-binding NarL/FixJ family response regulator
MADLLPLIEAAYRFDLSDAECLHELVRASDGLSPRHPTMAFSCGWDPDRGKTVEHLEMTRGDPALAARVFGAIDGIPFDQQRYLATKSPTYTTVRELLPFAARASSFVGSGIPDCLGMMCTTGAGDTLVVGSVRDAAEPVSHRQRLQFAPVTAHLAAAWRLRRRLAGMSSLTEAAAAVFFPDGRCAHAEGSARRPAVRAALRDAVLQRRAVREAGSNDGNQRWNSFWDELVGGRWTLVDVFENAQTKYVVAIRNDFAAQGFTALSSRERAVIEHVRRGASNKEIALTLGCSEPSVSRLVRRATRKLGLPSIIEIGLLGADTAEAALYDLRIGPDLLRVAGLPLREPELLETLTGSERAVLADLLRGYSNREIAAHRGRSLRTVGNQVAGLLAKFDVNSRRELAALLGMRVM